MLRARLRISQAELARGIGISRQAYSLIETKKHRMTWVTYIAMIVFFFGGQEKPKSSGGSGPAGHVVSVDGRGEVRAIQDLLRVIEKLLSKNRNAQAASGREDTPAAQTATVDSLLKPTLLFLEDSDWNSAANYCNCILDIDPENGEAYVGLLMSELRVRKEEGLALQDVIFRQKVI